MSRKEYERGAAAVVFAIIVLVLLTCTDRKETSQSAIPESHPPDSRTT